MPFYTLNITSPQNCTLTFAVGDPPSGEEPPPGGEAPPSGGETPPSGEEPPAGGEIPPSGEEPPTEESKLQKGDTNGDSKVSLTDIVNIKRHILGIELLTGDSLIAADTNGDSKVSLTDIVAVKRHILGIEEL